MRRPHLARQSNVLGGVKLRNTLQDCWSDPANWRPMVFMYDSFLSKPMNFSHAKQHLSLVALTRRLTLSAAAALLAMGSAHAQTQAPQAPAPVAAAEAPAPRYTASKLEFAFNYMDGDRDGKISRAEAAGFRGVAKYFDEADTDRDNFLSRAEFDAAMNHAKAE
jgi:hypothetical protein